MHEAQDFKAESDSIAAVLADANEDVFATVTQFKNWTIEDVLGHLHVWNIAAFLTLKAPDAFKNFIEDFTAKLTKSRTHIEAQHLWLEENARGLRGKSLYETYCAFYPKLAASYDAADSEARVAWAGPDMSTRSKIIARQMETWSHGQEIFDILGEERQNTDRVKNIAHLGVTTYGWTFRNRKETPPTPKPFVQLTAPSGAIWEWNEPQDDSIVCGSAVEFAQIVTQTRNVKDTAIETRGTTAKRWMEIAQCFAGKPEAPPAKGMRYKSAARKE